MDIKYKILKTLAIVIICLVTLTGHAYAEEQDKVVNEDTYFGVLECNLWNIHVGQDQAGYYINGNVDICEWVNEKVRPLNKIPKIELISTDGKVSKEFKVESRKQYDWGSEYYFYLDIDGIDIWKEYKVKITNLDTNNTNPSKSKEATIQNWTIGNYWEFKVETKNNVIYFNNPATYVGYIDCNLWNIESTLVVNSYYLRGNIDICQWINGKTIPVYSTPKIQLISEDGTVVRTATDTLERVGSYIECRNKYEWGNEYYFQIYLEGISPWSEYKIRVVDTDNNNISENKTKIIDIKKDKIGTYWEYNVNTKNNNTLYLSLDTYVGYTDCNLWNIEVKNTDCGYQLTGKIDICEWVDGKTRPLYHKPVIELIYEDGTLYREINAYLIKEYDWGTQYNLFLNINYIDITKEYKIRITSHDIRNINPNTTKIVDINTDKIGTYWEYNINIKNNDTIYFAMDTYVGYLDCNLWYTVAEQELFGDSYIYGCIDICEWVDNKTRPLSTKPKMQLVSEDGKTYEIYLEANNTYDWGAEYAFFICINGIDTTKEYKIILENTEIRNTNPIKTKEATINTEEIGAYEEYSVYVKNNNTIYFEEDSYIGYTDCNLWNIGIEQTDEYGYVMYGYIDICEWVDNKTRPLYALPEIMLVDIDGNVFDNAYLVRTNKYNWGGQYYFEIPIEGIDIWKEYAIIVENTDVRNTNPDTMVVPSINTNRIGKYWQYNIDVIDNCIMYFNL